MHDNGWKDNYFKLAEVSMIGHVCGTSVYTQFYDQIDKICKIISRPYTGSCFGTKIYKLLK